MNAMKVAELKSLARERGLRGYLKLRKAELIKLLESVPAARSVSSSQSNPSSREMDIFEKSEMAKKRSVVKTKLSEWHDWLINHVPKQIKGRVSSLFRSAKKEFLKQFDKVTPVNKAPPKEETVSEKVFVPIEQAFDKAYRRF